MIRRLLILAAFLVAGAVVNVAVAWGWAVWVAPHGSLWLFSGDTWLDDHHLWSVNVDPGPGYAEVLSTLSSIDEYRDEYAAAISGASPAADAIPTWSRLSRPDPENPTTPEFHSESAFGWPWLAMTYECAGAITRHPGVRVVPWEVSGGVVVSRPMLGANDRPFRALPLRPLLRGTLANTVFYAAALWLLWFLKILRPFTLLRRLRIKRGLCPACGYPMGDAATCSECGRALPGRAGT